MQNFRQSVQRAKQEEGFILLAVLFLVVLILIALAVAAPSVARSIQRDKEVELVNRGEQYKRAVKLYYKKFGAYPTSIDQLINTNNIRFLRKRYTDPITGKDDWRLIYFGQAKVPPMGLFGQPLIAPGLAGGAIGAVPGAPPTTAAGTSAFGSNAGSSAFGSTPTSTYGTAAGNTPDSSNSPDTGDNSGTSSSVESSATNPSATITAAAPAPQSGATPPYGSNPTAGTPGTPGTGTGAFGSTLGGGPIVGVGIPVPKSSLIEYKKQKKYSQWEFVYNPIEDTLLAGGLAGGGTQNLNGNPAGTAGIGSGNSTGIGSTPNSGGFGSTSGTGSGTGDTGTGGTTPPTSSNPQQQ
jgi:type II secretory pathway pseudopilin PulG